jgi:hypothetical protein
MGRAYTRQPSRRSCLRRMRYRLSALRRRRTTCSRTVTECVWRMRYRLSALPLKRQIEYFYLLLRGLAHRSVKHGDKLALSAMSVRHRCMLSVGALGRVRMCTARGRPNLPHGMSATAASNQFHRASDPGDIPGAASRLRRGLHGSEGGLEVSAGTKPVSHKV